jgi:hypothetical protein
VLKCDSLAFSCFIDSINRTGESHPVVVYAGFPFSAADIYKILLHRYLAGLPRYI